MSNKKETIKVVVKRAMSFPPFNRADTPDSKIDLPVDQAVKAIDYKYATAATPADQKAYQTAADKSKKEKR